MQQNDPGIMRERIIQGRTKCKSKDPEAGMFWTAIMDERKRSKREMRGNREVRVYSAVRPL